MKATHQGHCQVCGSDQKLPNGLLSKHGYTRQWGFFDGICSGTKHLPFEQDISLIEGMIAWAKKNAALLRAEAATRRTMTDPEDVLYHMYFNENRRGSGYRWTPTRIFMDYPDSLSPRSGVLSYQHPGDRYPTRAKRVDAGCGYKVAEAVKELNDRYARHLEDEAKRREQYAKWQEDRIKDWKPQPLNPVTDRSTVVDNSK